MTAGYPAGNEHVQLKTSKQLTKIRQCLVRVGLPAHDDKRLWKVVDGWQGPSSRETANPEVFPDQERHPYPHHAAGESTLIEQGRSTARGASS